MSSDDPSVPYGYCHCGCGRKTNLATTTRPALGVVKGEPVRFCQGHGRRKSGAEYVEQDCGHTSPCWVWQLAVSGGYGMCGRDGKMWGAHRWYYVQAHGPVPDGLQLDHLCRNRLCVNPDHLEPVSQAENVRRGANTKLTRAEARAIRASVEDAREVARKYGVDRNYVYMIRNGRSWREV